MRQLYVMASGEFIATLDGSSLAKAGLTLEVIAYDVERDVWRVLLSGDALPAAFEVPPGAYPREGNVRFLRNALDDALVVIATETHDAMGWE